MKKILALSIAVSMLAACASPARIGAMVATPSSPLSANAKISNSVGMGNVSGGSKTNPLWKSNVGNPEFQEALRQSLNAYGLLANATPRYRLDAMLIDVQQPFIGLDLKVVTSVHYQLFEISNGKTIYDQSIQADYTASMGDSFIAAERLLLPLKDSASPMRVR